MATIKKAVLLVASVLLVGSLAGCKNDNSDAAYRSAPGHDEVGEMRVFDDPPRRVARRGAVYQESVPAPAPMRLDPQRHRAIVGEINVFDY